MSRIIIGVIGGSDATPAQERDAFALGAGIAERGATLICGGRSGVMAAACRGARSTGGTTIGVLPGTDRTDANPWVDIPIVTGLGEARNLIIVRTADALVAVGGRYGTLTEIAFALHANKPVVGLHTWGLQPPSGSEAAPLLRASTPQDALDQLWTRLTDPKPNSERGNP